MAQRTEDVSPYAPVVQALLVEHMEAAKPADEVFVADVFEADHAATVSRLLVENGSNERRPRQLTRCCGPPSDRFSYLPFSASPGREPPCTARLSSAAGRANVVL